MDRETVGAYDAGAAGFAKDWHEQPAPVDLHALVKRFFHPGGRTADVGCGSGREVAFLAAEGFDADRLRRLRRAARAGAAPLSAADSLRPPCCRSLAGVPDAAFDNVLCETVIMHLRASADPRRGPPPARHPQARRHSLSELARHRRRRPARCARPALLRLRERADSRGDRRRSDAAARRRAGQRVVGQENPSHRGAQVRAMTLSAAPPER